MADEKKGFFGFIKGIGRSSNYSEEEAQQRSYALAKSQEEEQHGDTMVLTKASVDPQLQVMADFAQEKLNEMLQLAGFSGTAVAETDEDRINLEIKNTEDQGRLIGKEGSTLESLQVLVRTFIQKKFNQPVKLSVDIGDYRKRKNEQLLQQAKQAARSVMEKNLAVDLRPMTASERRLVHTHFQDDKYIQTRSMGEGSQRHIVLEKKVRLPPNDTIVALATPPGRGAIGIIRLSGSAATGIMARVFVPGQLKQPRYFYRGYIVNPQTNQKLDDVCAVYFQAPYSYTGEDVVEIHGHGNPLTLQAIVLLLQAEGARLAEKGEFTKRAFLNGKIDLTEAEGVLELINARSSKAQTAALAHLQGSLFQFIQEIRRRLLKRLAAGEATLDFPDDVAPAATQNEREIRAIIERLVQVIKNQDYGKMVTGAIKCLIVGRPNVGKSSLLNCLAGEERAIVTAFPGTTRDFIDVQIELGGLLFEFIDTAGLRANPDAIEKLGVRKVTDLLRKAHLVFWVLDGAQEYSAEDAVVFAKIPKKKPLYLIINKADKKQHLALPAILKKYPVLPLSATKKTGLNNLKERLCQDFARAADELDIDLLCNTRQINGLKEALISLRAFVAARQKGWPEDIALMDLKNAVLHLGRITGEELNEEVLDQIFSEFCIGK